MRHLLQPDVVQKSLWKGQNSCFNIFWRNCFGNSNTELLSRLGQQLLFSRGDICSTASNQPVGEQTQQQYLTLEHLSGLAKYQRYTTSKDVMNSSHNPLDTGPVSEEGISLWLDWYLHAMVWFKHAFAFADSPSGIIPLLVSVTHCQEWQSNRLHMWTMKWTRSVKRQDQANAMMQSPSNMYISNITLSHLNKTSVKPPFSLVHSWVMACNTRASSGSKTTIAQPTNSWQW